MQRISPAKKIPAQAEGEKKKSCKLKIPLPPPPITFLMIRPLGRKDCVTGQKSVCEGGRIVSCYSPLDGMLANRRAVPPALCTWDPFIHLGEERQCGDLIATLSRNGRGDGEEEGVSNETLNKFSHGKAQPRKNHFTHQLLL